MQSGNRISGEETAAEALAKLAEGKDEAALVAGRIVGETESVAPDYFLGAIGMLLKFDEYALYGEKILLLYAMCDRSIEKTIRFLIALDGRTSATELDAALCGALRLDIDAIIG